MLQASSKLTRSSGLLCRRIRRTRPQLLSSSSTGIINNVTTTTSRSLNSAGSSSSDSTLVNAFDDKNTYVGSGPGGGFGIFSSSGSSSWKNSPPPAFHRDPVLPHRLSPTRKVPSHIIRPPYAETGQIPFSKYGSTILIHDEASIEQMRTAARLARKLLDYACSIAKSGITTDEIDQSVHEAIIEHGAYPSPLNYAGFPKSLCSSINEVICHGIPDSRPLQRGDIVSFDVSCFLNGVHGDNCATIIVDDEQNSESEIGVDWRGVPYRTTFDSDEEEASFRAARRLVYATRESLYAAIETCRPGSCLSEVGGAIQDVADAYGYSTVEKYRGHGIGDEFHCAPFVKHFRNKDAIELVPGMIFTIEPMLVEAAGDCFEWTDEWTVATTDGGMAAQFEHTVLITKDGVEILTLPESEWE